jgi:hypothetical protein
MMIYRLFVDLCLAFVMDKITSGYLMNGRSGKLHTETYVHK